jgi:hypothetical protein
VVDVRSFMIVSGRTARPPVSFPVIMTLVDLIASGDKFKPLSVKLNLIVIKGDAGFVSTAVNDVAGVIWLP